MRILVTGAKGQLGTELMALLEPSHHESLGVDLDHGDHTLDITDRAMVRGVVTTWRPDAIIHGAAFTAVDVCESEPELAYTVNALATRHLADAARDVGARAPRSRRIVTSGGLRWRGRFAGALHHPRALG